MTAFGRYELLEVLGQGGFATVHRAYDPILDRPLAIKVLHGYLAGDSQMAERFIREGRALARVNHPNLVNVYDAGTEENQAFLAMEYVEGKTLAELSAGRQMPLAEAGEIIRQVAGAIAAVHGAGLIHRDIKPANIIVEPNGRAVLLDLGVARDMDSTGLTVTGLVVGTPGFLAPEQVDSTVFVGPSTDIYQLAATTYTLLAGKPLYEGDTAQVLYAVAHRPPPDLGEARPDLPYHAIAAVSRGLSKDPAQRPSTVIEFAEGLRSPAEALRPTVIAAPGAAQTVVSTDPGTPSAAATVVSGSHSSATAAATSVPSKASAVAPQPDPGAPETAIAGAGESSGPSRTMLYAVLGAIVVVALIAVAFVFLRGGGGGTEEAAGISPGETVTATPISNGDFEPYGTPTTFEVNWDEATTFAFPAPKSGVVSFVVERSEVGAYYRILDDRDKPVGSNKWIAPTGGMFEPVELPRAGDYKLEVRPDKAEGGELLVTMYEVTEPDPVPITAGAEPVALSVDTPGSVARATFDANAGQRFSIQTYGTVGGYYLSVESTSGPSVQRINYTWIPEGDFFVDTFVVETAGSYALVADPTEDTLISTKIQLFSVPEPARKAITIGATETIATIQPGENVEFSFSGKRDQQISLRVSRVKAGSYVYVQRAFNDSKLENVWAGPPQGNLVVLTLPVDDDYIITIDPAGGALESASLAVYDVTTEPTAETTIGGQAASVTTDYPGQQATVTFTSAGGESITIHSLRRDDAYITLLDPASNKVINRQYLRGGDSYQVKEALVAGRYTLRVEPTAFDPGSYSFEFVRQ
ncbi:MAG: serine/threonine protein kinase [Dehalococcoidia bacterium]